MDYMKNNSLSGPSVNLSKVDWISVLMLFGIGFSFTAGGFLEKLIGPLFTALIGGWLMSLNVALLYFTLKSYISIVILSYGLLSGIGIGFAYGSALGAPLTWFPKNRGLITGLIVSGFGIFQTIFTFIQSQFTNNCTKKNLMNFPESCLILGIIYSFLQFIGSIFLKNQPLEEVSQNPDISVENRQTYGESFYPRRLSLFEEKPDLKPHQILREFDFWILWLTFFLNSTCVIFIFQLARQYAISIGISHGEENKCLKTFIIVCDIFKFCGRIFWGFLMDRKSYKVVMFIITILSSIFIGTLSTIEYIEKTKREYVYGLWISLINFLLSGIFSIFPTICGRCFGMKYFICNYGILYTASSVSGLVVSAIISNNVDEIHKKSFDRGPLISCSVISLIAAGVTLLFRGKSSRIYSF